MAYNAPLRWLSFVIACAIDATGTQLRRFSIAIGEFGAITLKFERLIRRSTDTATVRKTTTPVRNATPADRTTPADR